MGHPNKRLVIEQIFIHLKCNIVVSKLTYTDVLGQKPQCRLRLFESCLEMCCLCAIVMFTVFR